MDLIINSNENRENQSPSFGTGTFLSITTPENVSSHHQFSSCHESLIESPSPPSNNNNNNNNNKDADMNTLLSPDPLFLARRSTPLSRLKADRRQLTSRRLFDSFSQGLFGLYGSRNRVEFSGLTLALHGLPRQNGDMIGFNGTAQCQNSASIVNPSSSFPSEERTILPKTEKVRQSGGSDLGFSFFDRPSNSTIFTQKSESKIFSQNGSHFPPFKRERMR